MTRVTIGVNGVSGPIGPTGPAGAAGPAGPPGAPGMNYQGTWNSGTTYTANQWVQGSDGNYYFSLAGGNIGNNPTTDQGVHWGVIALTDFPQAGKLTAGASAAATSISADAVTMKLAANSYIGIDVGVSNLFEMATVSSISGGNITLASGLVNAHSAGARIERLDGFNVPYWWCGLVGDGVTDDSVNLCLAGTALYGTNQGGRMLVLDGHGHSFALAGPVVYPSEMRRTQMKYVITSAFTPADCDNAMICEQGGGYPNPNTFTASGGVITTALSNGMVTGSSLMLRNTTGLTGALEGRIYYWLKLTANTGSLCSTLQQATIVGTSDVTATAGSGNIYPGLQDIGRCYLEEEYITPSATVGATVQMPGVNAYRRNGQQPGYARKFRVQGSSPCWPPGTFAMIGPAGLAPPGAKTSFNVRALNPFNTGIPQTILNGATVYTIEGSLGASGNGALFQAWTLSAQANSGATSLSVNSQTPVGSFASNTAWVATAPVITGGAGGTGTMNDGSYMAQVTYVNYLGESLGSVRVPVTVATGNNTGSIFFASPAAMTNAGDQSNKSSNAQWWYAYLSQTNVVDATVALTAAKGSTSVTAISPALAVSGVYYFPSGTAGITPGTTLTVSPTTGVSGTLSLPTTAALSAQSVPMIAVTTRQQVTGTGYLPGSGHGPGVGPTPQAIGTNLTITTAPSTTGAAPPQISTAGAWGLWLSGQGGNWINCQPGGQCDTAILAEGAQFMDWFGRFDVEQITSYGVRTMPASTFAISGGSGLLNWKMDGLHTELSPVLTTNFIDLSWPTAADTTVSLDLGTLWISRAGSQPSGAFINNPNSQSGIIWDNIDGTFPGVPGYAFIRDPLNGNRDFSTDYAQSPPPLAIVAPRSGINTNPIRSIDVIGPGIATLGGLALFRVPVNDVNLTIAGATNGLWASYIGYTALTAARTVTLPPAAALAGAAMVVIIVDEVGAAGTHAIGTAASTGPTNVLDTLHGTTSLNTNFGMLINVSNGVNAWKGFLV